MLPGHRCSFFIEAGGQPVKEGRPVHVVLDIFLARPHDFDWAVNVFSDLDSADDAIDLQPAAKAAADQVVVDPDLVQRQASGLCRRHLCPPEYLVAAPDLPAVLPAINRAVHRLTPAWP